MQTKPQTPLRDPSVIIVGAGMTGILLTIKLREAGITQITVLEKKGNLGGTWRENTYPGVACDVPAYMYTYSFEPNPDWTQTYPTGDQIQAYFERVARKYGVTDIIRFDEEVIEARYHQGKWQVRTNRQNGLEADFLINATGILHQVSIPDIPGLQDFKGDWFHTAQWDHQVSLNNKRIGIIGTGSTASQVIPELAKSARNLTVFQRTPQWVFPANNKIFGPRWRRAYRNSRMLQAFMYRYASVLLEMTFSRAVIGQKIPHAYISWMAKRNLRKSIKDPNLKQKLTPDYTVGCKRLIISDHYYKALQQPNVEIITEGIECINEQGIKTRNGQQFNLDTLVFATGFDPFAFMRPMKLYGKHGIEISERWQQKIQAYRSMFIPDFPNYALMLGPNTPIGNYSVIMMSEVQTNYLIQLIQRWREHQFDEISARETAMQAFNAYLKAGMSKTVWVGGCQSWYLDSGGDPAMWPYTWGQWVREMASPRMEDFETHSFEAMSRAMDKTPDSNDNQHANAR